MKRASRSLLGLWLSALITAAHGQTPEPPEVNLFGDDFPARSRIVRFVPPKQKSSANPAPAEDYGQTLLFHDGRQIRGNLMEITANEIVWQRKDASAPMRFPRTEIRRITLVTVNPMLPAAEEKPSAAPLATVKLPGGDWLRGALASPDGQSFSLTMGEGAPLVIGRAQIEWLAFGPKAAPAYGFGVGAMALEGWLAGGMPTIETSDGVIKIKDVTWIGRLLPSPKRFEIAFEVPESAESNLRLWLQPFQPQPNSYSMGTVQLQFFPEKLQWLVYHDNLQPTQLDLPAEARNSKGPVQYRIFYDNPAQRLVVFRNGAQAADLSLKPKIERPGVGPQDRPLQGFCFDYENRGQKVDFQFRRLNVLPWNGVVPTKDEVAGPEDRLSKPATPAQRGSLEKVEETQLTFAGQSIPIDADTFIKFPQAPAPMAATESIVSFGPQGEVSLADLRMHDGKVQGRTVFAPALEMPADALQSIGFAPSSSAGNPTAGQLVFKNGDELPGTLIRAASDASLRWRLASGQEIEFQTERVAGIRLGASPKLQASSTMELRNGERIRGEMTSFNEAKLQWQHAILGAMEVERGQLWRLYPNPKQSILDGGQSPVAWLEQSSKNRRFIYYNQVREGKTAWTLLDGRFAMRARDVSGSEQTMGPSFEVADNLDRYELRVDMNCAGENAGTLNVNLMGADEGRVGINLSSYEMSVFMQNPRARGGGMNRDFPYRDKLGDNLRQFSLRVFVNRPAGTVDLCLNGYMLGRLGQNAADRLPGVGKRISIDTYTYGRSQTIIAQIAAVPWSGELPRPGDSTPVTILANGDTAPGLPSTWADGRWRVESEIGPLDLPGDKVQAVEFGGAMQPVNAAARVRLVDGSALLVDRFEWSGDTCAAQHPLFGALQIPAASVSELIYLPPPVRAPQVLDPKTLAKKDAQNPALP